MKLSPASILKFTALLLAFASASATAEAPATAETVFLHGRILTLDSAGTVVQAVAVNDGIFDLLLHQRGMLRPLRAAELSDGTLRFLLWGAALLGPSPPSLMVLNEPETSLHPDLVGPLADMIAAEREAVTAQTVQRRQ